MGTKRYRNSTRKRGKFGAINHYGCVCTTSYRSGMTDFPAWQQPSQTWVCTGYDMIKRKKSKKNIYIYILIYIIYVNIYIYGYYIYFVYISKYSRIRADILVHDDRMYELLYGIHLSLDEDERVG